MIDDVDVDDYYENKECFQPNRVLGLQRKEEAGRKVFHLHHLCDHQHHCLGFVYTKYRLHKILFTQNIVYIEHCSHQKLFAPNMIILTPPQPNRVYG